MAYTTNMVIETCRYCDKPATIVVNTMKNAVFGYTCTRKDHMTKLHKIAQDYDDGEMRRERERLSGPTE